jgi:hypothetical protein
MKFNKLAAAGATFALVVGSVVGIGAAASAIDVPIDQIGVEGASYPAATWFLGNPVGPALSQDTTGLTIPGQNQLLYGQSTTVATGAAFTDLIDGAAFAATGTATFQVPVFFDGTANTAFTTLRPAVPGTPTTSTEWISSRTIASLGLTAGVAVPFATIAAAFDTAADAEVLAFGVFVNAGDTAVLQSVTWNGETWTFAAPTPDAEVPTPVQDPARFTG